MGRSKHRTHSNGRSGSQDQSFAPEQPVAPAPATAVPAPSVAVDEAAEPVSGTTWDATEYQEQLEFLTCELDDRDQVIAALTTQLEGAVEQLDRLHRQGADRGRPGGTGGLTQEFLGEQRAIADRMSQWLDQWDQTQPMDLWLRMEARVNELASHLGSPTAPAIVYQEASFSSGNFAPATPEPAESFPSSWEETKQRLLGEYSDPASFQTSPPAEAPAPAAAVVETEMPLPGGHIEFPLAVDVESAEREELVKAIEIRDRYISDLTHRLRSAEMRQPVDWDALSQAPADLRQQLVDLESRYRDHLRREECDLALERARLAREQARLKQDRHRFDQQMRRSGLAMDDEQGTPMDADERSWLKMFGRKR